MTGGLRVSLDLATIICDRDQHDMMLMMKGRERTIFTTKDTAWYATLCSG